MQIRKSRPRVNHLTSPSKAFREEELPCPKKSTKPERGKKVLGAKTKGQKKLSVSLKIKA